MDMKSRNTIIVSILFTVALSACGTLAPEPLPTTTLPPTNTVVPTPELTVTPEPTLYPNPADWDLLALGTENWNQIEVQPIELADWQFARVMRDLSLYWNATVYNEDFPDCKLGSELVHPFAQDLKDEIAGLCPQYVELGEYFSDPPLSSLRIHTYLDGLDSTIILILDTNGQTWERPAYFSSNGAFKYNTEVKPTNWTIYLLYDPEMDLWRVVDSLIAFED
jgi:hypothetical protein